MQSDNANMIDEAGKLNELIKEATKRLDVIKKKLKAELNPDELSAGGPVIMLGTDFYIDAKMTTPRRSFPIAAVEEAEEEHGIDLSPYIKTSAPSVTMYIKERK